jgi:hypothetical protein
VAQPPKIAQPPARIERSPNAIAKRAQQLINEAELLAAAQILEEAGDELGAAELKVEHARTLTDLGRRLDILRDTVARLSPGTAPARHANAALAQSLADAIHLALDGGASTPSLELERAHALVAANLPDEAGAIFEKHGLIDQAIAAYTAGGCIAELEYLLKVREHRQRTRQKQREVSEVLNRAHLAGRRNDEAALLQTARLSAGEVMNAEFESLLRDREFQLRRALLARDVVRFRVRREPGKNVASSEHELIVWQRQSFIIGRSPLAQLVVPAPALSREHARIDISQLPEAFSVRLFDLSTKLGTYVDSELVDSEFGVEITGRSTLMLATLAPFSICLEKWNDETIFWIDEPGQPRKIHQIARGACPLFIDDGHRGLARLVPREPCPVVDFSPQVQVWLNGHRLRRGADPELLAGDRLRVVGENDEVWEIETIAGVSA